MTIFLGGPHLKAIYGVKVNKQSSLGLGFLSPGLPCHWRGHVSDQILASSSTLTFRVQAATSTTSTTSTYKFVLLYVHLRRMTFSLSL